MSDQQPDPLPNFVNSTLTLIKIDGEDRIVIFENGKDFWGEMTESFFVAAILPLLEVGTGKRTTARNDIIQGYSADIIEIDGVFQLLTLPAQDPPPPTPTGPKWGNYKDHPRNPSNIGQNK